VSGYGALGGIVAAAGSVMAAGGAITLAFKGRARWEPIEEDVPKAPAKAAALATAVCVVLIWAAARRRHDPGWLVPLCLGCLIATFVGMCLYVWLVQVHTFTAKFATGRRHAVCRKVIGGLWLTTDAKKAMLHRPDGPIPLQRLFEGAAYDKNLLWSGNSQFAAKLLFLVAFLALQVCGSLSLASAAILLDAVTMGSG
jgi:hypothetical protein